MQKNTKTVVENQNLSFIFKNVFKNNKIKSESYKIN